MANHNQIQLAILKTVAFFDCLDWPLTAFEIHKYLWQHKASLREVMTGLQELSSELDSNEGFYFLPGREELIAKRKQGYIYSWPKIKAVVRVTKLMRYIPGVRLVSICNSVAIGNIKSTSDIDLFIVTAGRRLWLTRFFVTGLVHIFGLRRHGLNISNRFCLSFYVSEASLNLESILLKEDPYFAYWLASLFVVYDAGGIHKKLLLENKWLFEALPNFEPVRPARRFRITTSKLARYLDKYFLASWADELEERAKSLELEIMKRHDHIEQSSGAAVVITDQMLKFHEDDRREFFHNEWQKRLMKIHAH